ncbi:MAG: hypothetical protein U9O95_08395 [Candidatus Marinimicrobia bacterium]|nr:hypothetical protein [Candidatus Neomarinimicrobiota bacterium]
MKKVIISIMSMIMLVIVFSGCNNIIVDKDQFDLLDTVTIAINEKLYENPNLWVRLDSITKDDRCYEDLLCGFEGSVVAWFSIGTADSLFSLMFSTDTLNCRIFSKPATDVIPWGGPYWMTIVDVTPQRVEGEVIQDEDYRVHFVLEQGMVVYKPNIYLYPKITSKMDVSLDFPQGGHVTVSDPNYPDEWQNIKVSSSGKIDGRHDFLFYEAALPDHWQYDEGWSLKQAGLKIFFEDNLTDYGFNMREIADFTEYWIPRLKESPYYAIYPQHTAKINEVVELNISKTPRSILRLFYVIKEIPEFEDMHIPYIPDFERKGFTVTEWGVIL